MLDLYGDMAANVIGRREYADTAPFTFVDGVEEAITVAEEFAGDRVTHLVYDVSR